MEAGRGRRLRTIAVPMFWMISAGIPLFGQSCTPVNDALNKVMMAPVHIYSSTKSGDKVVTTETIYSDDGIFTNSGGKWQKSAMRREQVAQQESEARKKGTNSCEFVKEESVDGETASIYSTRMSAGEQKTEGHIWISKSRGVPLRNEVDLLSGPKGEIKRHYSVRYDYKNIAPPKM
jgi:hypothetical protein